MSSNISQLCAKHDSFKTSFSPQLYKSGTTWDSNVRKHGRIQTVSTYANAEVTSALVKLLENTEIPMFFTKLFSSSANRKD